MLEEPITNIYWKWASPESQDRMLYIGASYVYDKTKPVEWKCEGKFCYTCYIRHRYYKEVLFPSLKSQFFSKGVQIVQSLNKTALEIFSEAHKKNGMTSPFDDMKKMSSCENWLNFITNALDLFKECKKFSKKPVRDNCEGERYESCPRCSKWLSHLDFPMYTTRQQFWEGAAAWLHFVFRAQRTALTSARIRKNLPAADQKTDPPVSSPTLGQQEEEKKDGEKMKKRKERRMSEGDARESLQSPSPLLLRLGGGGGGRSDPRVARFLEEEAEKLKRKLTSARNKLWMSCDSGDDDDDADDVSDAGNDTDDMEQVMANQTQWRGKCGRSSAQSFTNAYTTVGTQRRRRFEHRQQPATLPSTSSSSSSPRAPPAPKPLSSPYGINLQAALIPVGSYNANGDGIVYRKIRPNGLPDVVRVMEEMYRKAVALHQANLRADSPPPPPPLSLENAVGSNPAVVFEYYPDEKDDDAATSGEEAMDVDKAEEEEEAAPPPSPLPTIRKSQRARKRKRRETEIIYELSSTDDEAPPSPPLVSYRRPSDDEDLYELRSVCDDDGWTSEEVIDCCSDDEESLMVSKARAGLACRSLIAQFDASCANDDNDNLFELDTIDGMVPPSIQSVKHNFNRHTRSRNSRPSFTLMHVTNRSYSLSA